MKAPTRRYRSTDADEALIDRAIAVYQPDSPTPLTREDGREIIYNLSGAFGLLLRWKRAQLAKAAKAARTPAPPIVAETAAPAETTKAPTPRRRVRKPRAKKARTPKRKS